MGNISRSGLKQLRDGGRGEKSQLADLALGSGYV